MGEPVVEKVTDLGGGVTETTVVEVVGEVTAEDLATIQRYQSAGFEGVVAPPLEVNPTGVGEFFGEYVNSPGTEPVRQYSLYGDVFPSGVREQKRSQAAEFAAAQAAAQSAAITKNAQEYDDAVYNLTRDYNLARIERLEAKAAFERELDSQANAYQQQRVRVQLQSIDRQVAESDRQFQLQLEGLENQRSDFERSNSTSADPFRALGAGAVGANSPLAAYAKQVMDLGIASDEEKLLINEKVAAEQEAARQGALDAQRQQSLIDEQQLITNKNNASLAWIQGYGSDAVEAARQGMALEDLGRYYSLREQKIRTGTNVATGAAQLEYPSEIGTFSDSVGAAGSVVDEGANGALTVVNQPTVTGGYVPPVPAPPEANVFDGLIAAQPKPPVTNQTWGFF